MPIALIFTFLLVISLLMVAGATSPSRYIHDREQTRERWRD